MAETRRFMLVIVVAVIVGALVTVAAVFQQPLAGALAAGVPAAAGVLVAYLTWEYLRATRELASSSRSLERLAVDQQARAKPQFQLEKPYAVAGMDGNTYVHFYVSNSGWKDCAIGECTFFAIAPDGATTEHELSLIQKNRAKGVTLEGGQAAAEPTWIPQEDFMVVSGGRRRATARGRTGGFDPKKAGWSAKFRVRGVLPTEDTKPVELRERS